MNTRDSYFDNAKVFLIMLVVFGHIIRSFIDDSQIFMNIYKFVYTFHMPAFILISGYFAKSFRKKGYVLKIAKKLILPYLIFQGIYSVYYFFIENQSSMVLNPLDPHWSLWFLVSLFFWNVLLFLVTKLPPAWALFLAFAAGLIVGYIDFISNYLSLSRTFVFFPLFLIGFYLKKKHFAVFTKAPVRAISGCLLLITFLSYFYLEFDYEWLFGSKSYSHFGEPSIISAFMRLGFYSLTIITSISFLSLIPRNKSFYTEWGTRTFYVYLLHGFIIQYMRNSELLNWMKDYQSLTFMVILSILLTSTLSTGFVKAVTQPFIELKASTFKYYVRNFTEKSWR